MAPSTTSRSTSGRRAAGLLATAALASLLTVTPAFARPWPGEPLPSPGSRPAGSTLQGSAPTTAPDSRDHRGVGATTEENRISRQQMAPDAPSAVPPTVTLDDDAVEYLQVALGALGGMALVGAVAAAASRRHGGHAHPA